MSERTEKMKQKQWVQIAAVFFGLMIVLTICSRAASSAVTSICDVRADGDWCSGVSRTAGRSR